MLPAVLIAGRRQGMVPRSHQRMLQIGATARPRCVREPLAHTFKIPKSMIRKPRTPVALSAQAQDRERLTHDLLALQAKQQHKGEQKRTKGQRRETIEHARQGRPSALSKDRRAPELRHDHRHDDVEHATERNSVSHGTRCRGPAPRRATVSRLFGLTAIATSTNPASRSKVCAGK